MFNPEDYTAGWTKKAFNPNSGKHCSGAAARNMHLKKMGGVSGVEANAFMRGVQFMAPLVEGYQQQLAKSELVLNEAVQQLAAIKGVKKPR